MPECYIHGNSIKYLRIPDEVIDLVPEEEERESMKKRKLFEILFNRTFASEKIAFRGGGRGRGRGGNRDGSI